MFFLAIYQKMDTSMGLSSIASLSLGLSMPLTGPGVCPLAMRGSAAARGHTTPHLGTAAVNDNAFRSSQQRSSPGPGLQQPSGSQPAPDQAPDVPHLVRLGGGRADDPSNRRRPPSGSADDDYDCLRRTTSSIASFERTLSSAMSLFAGCQVKRGQAGSCPVEDHRLDVHPLTVGPRRRRCVSERRFDVGGGCGSLRKDGNPDAESSISSSSLFRKTTSPPRVHHLRRTFANPKPWRQPWRIPRLITASLPGPHVTNQCGGYATEHWIGADPNREFRASIAPDGVDNDYSERFSHQSGGEQGFITRQSVPSDARISTVSKHDNDASWNPTMFVNPHEKHYSRVTFSSVCGDSVCLKRIDGPNCVENGSVPALILTVKQLGLGPPVNYVNEWKCDKRGASSTY